MTTNRICRLCRHEESRHTGEMFECGYVAHFLTEANVESFCACFKFIPEDNLEFLELKVKQKEDSVLHI